MASRPTKLALKILIRSATLAKRHRPRYSPTFQKATACRATTISTSSENRGKAGAFSNMA
ncbi:hypothetical protein D3C81_1678690 [compost metagenome]